MDLGLSGHPVVVIGGSPGIGPACARQFAAEGARVAIWDVRPPDANTANGTTHETTIDTTHDTADTALPAFDYQQVDISRLADLQQACERTIAALGPVQHVVNAAAVGSGKLGFPFTSLQPADWQRVIEVNVLGLTNVAHVLTPKLVAAGRGTFVMIASVAGQIGSPTDPPYSASKAANINFAQVMARDLAEHGIRVNTVCPGMVRTPLNRAVWQSWNERPSVEQQHSYGAWAEPKMAQLVPCLLYTSPSQRDRTRPRRPSAS